MFNYTEEELNKLSPEWRNALIDIDHNNLSYKEHAFKYGLTVGTVKSRMHRVRAKVRQIREQNVA